MIKKHIKNYLDYLKSKNYSARTTEEYYRELNYFYSWLKKINISRLPEITKKIITNYQNYLIGVKAKGTKKTLAIGTQSKKLIVVKEFFKYLTAFNILLNNPTSSLRLPKEQNTIKWTLLSVYNIKKIFKAINLTKDYGYRDRCILELLYSTGIRATELCNLQIKDIRFAENIIMIIKGKGSKDRSVPVCNRALKFTKYYIKNIRSKYKTEKSGDYIFLSWFGNKLCKRGLERIVTANVKRSGLKKTVSPQCFRIAAATHMLKNNCDIRYVQQLLGHSCIDTTMHYLRLEKSELKKVHNKTHPREKVWQIL